MPGINSRRHRLRVRQRDAFDGRLRQIFGRAHDQLAVAGHDDDQGIGQAVCARLRGDQALYGIHFRFIRGEKNVRRSALQNLPRQGTGTAEIQRDLLSRLPAVSLGDFLQTVRQTCRREHDNRACPRRRPAQNEAGRENTLEKPIHLRPV